MAPSRATVTRQAAVISSNSKPKGVIRKWCRGPGPRDEISLEVSDTGRGIPKSEQDKVFDFAYTTREGGNGLGLAMVHQVVVEEHGGRVSLESRPGEGTRVTLALPLNSPSKQSEEVS